jgi:hypothetical protein
MRTFPEINARVTDSDRIDHAVLSVVGIEYATGMVTLELRTHATPFPYGRPAESGTLTYRQILSRLTLAN